MKNLFILLLGIFIFLSCTDTDILNDAPTKQLQSPSENEDVLPRLVFSSNSELKDVINQLKDGISLTNLHTRAITTEQLSTTSESRFRSLLVVNKEKCLAKLSIVQLDSIRNDEEQLEYCPEDSVIADMQFAQLVNASREIQVGETVYKYLDNGVAYTQAENVKELNGIEKKAQFITVDPQSEPKEIALTDNVKFVAMPYKQVVTEEETSVATTRAIGESLALKNGVNIPASSIRDVNYYEKGDGNWFNRTWNGLWGRNIVAINKFSSKRKLTMNFYDQNYIIYANIGTELKMQKKVCGIWWNIEAQEIRQGWTAVELKYTFPSPIISKMPTNPFTKPATYKPELPAFMKHNFPFQDEEALLLHVPFTSYDLTNKNLNQAFMAGLNIAKSKASSYLKKQINGTKSSQVGLFSVNNDVIYVITGADEKGTNRRRSLETKFYSKWFPGTYVIGFSVGDGVDVKNVTLDGGKSTALHRGIVYGAIKYDNKWLGARITKDK
ncbi:hypothetical protein [Bacteroides neonati]|uniref:hypothetical protein n=1 Tax=Bacteroides neonati TaxID=1347393 RepID=UPI0004B9F314|nr:hypothetical protein [Bacteroides neonati]